MKKGKGWLFGGKKVLETGEELRKAVFEITEAFLMVHLVPGTGFEAGYPCTADVNAIGKDLVKKKKMIQFF